jgi:hypothetical protein
MFALFRFRIRRPLVLNALLVSFLMSQVSYFTRINPEIDEFSTYIQFMLFILVFWLFFLVPFFHSIVMNFAGVASGMLIQGLCIFSLLQLTGQTLDSFISNIWVASALQVLTAFIQIALARLIIIMNWGFDFVPTSPKASVRIKGTNAILISIVSFSVVLAALLSYVFRNNMDEYMTGASVVFILTLTMFIYYSVKKDNEDAR